ATSSRASLATARGCSRSARTQGLQCSIRTIREDPADAHRGERAHPLRVVHRVDGRLEAQALGARDAPGRDTTIVEADSPGVAGGGTDRHAVADMLHDAERRTAAK